MYGERIGHLPVGPVSPAPRGVSSERVAQETLLRRKMIMIKIAAKPPAERVFCEGVKCVRRSKIALPETRPVKQVGSYCGNYYNLILLVKGMLFKGVKRSYISIIRLSLQSSWIQ